MLNYYKKLIQSLELKNIKTTKTVENTSKPSQFINSIAKLIIMFTVARNNVEKYDILKVKKVKKIMKLINKS